MRTGQWRIVIAGSQIAVQRTINLSVGFPETTTVTVCDTPSLTTNAGRELLSHVPPRRRLRPSLSESQARPGPLVSLCSIKPD